MDISHFNFIHLPIDRHLDYFCFLGIIHVSLCEGFIPFGQIPRSGIAGSNGKFISIFIKNKQTT